jgi:ShK domain-like
VAPSKDYTCAQQKAFGKCNEAFMKGYCNNTCGRCPAAAAGVLCIMAYSNHMNPVHGYRFQKCIEINETTSASFSEQCSRTIGT